jgi:hypothetical protein
MVRRTLFLLVVMTMAVLFESARAQDAEKPPPPCSTSEARQLDFWIGDWDLTWEGGKGTNIISAILGGCVIEERFDGRNEEGAGLVGQSYSVYNPRREQWQQTWVDNQGGYLDFVGALVDGEMILSREAERDGKKFLQRMVFSNIAENELDWSWDRSNDGGETWKPVWVIHYTRKK